MQEMELKNEKLLADEGILSPQKEAELQGRLAALESKYDSLVSQNSALRDENAELRQQLANLKKTGLRPKEREDRGHSGE